LLREFELLGSNLADFFFHACVLHNSVTGPSGSQFLCKKTSDPLLEGIQVTPTLENRFGILHANGRQNKSSATGVEGNERLRLFRHPFMLNTKKEL